jgi:hypothetical protein
MTMDNRYRMNWITFIDFRVLSGLTIILVVRVTIVSQIHTAGGGGINHVSTILIIIILEIPNPNPLPILYR